MKTTCLLPSSDEITTVLERLFGKGVRVSWISQAEDHAPATVATYVDARGEVIAATACDLAIACHLGAALMLLPAPVARQCVKRGAIDADLADNLREVMNITSCFYRTVESDRRVILSELRIDGGALPDEIAGLLVHPRQRFDVRIHVSGYDPGTMTLMLA